MHSDPKNSKDLNKASSEFVSCLPKTFPSCLSSLEEHLLQHQLRIEDWLHQELQKTPPPFYASVDLRNAGFKLAPVDTNLFPAGFNNLNSDFLPVVVQALQSTLKQLAPGCQRILIIPENHTRNLFYLENLVFLRDALLKAGFEVRIASLLADVKDTLNIELPSGHSIQLEKIKRRNNRVGVDGFSACCVLLNNDLSSGIPNILQNLEQPLLPPLALGWSQRLKSQHFRYYSAACKELAKLIQLDPWLLDPLFQECKSINFLKREGEDCLIHHSEKLLENIQKKYTEYGIKHKPYVVIKADAGTYGIGVLSIHKPEEISRLNRKKRTAMSMAKGNRPITQVIIQEGVHTFETWNNAVAEPVIYMIGQQIAGGFYRVHTERGISDNLNTPGMHFEPLMLAKIGHASKQTGPMRQQINRFYAYGVVARLALVAAAREQANLAAPVDNLLGHL